MSILETSKLLRPLKKAYNAKTVQWVHVEKLKGLLEDNELGWDKNDLSFYLVDDLDANATPITQDEFNQLENEEPWKIFYNELEETPVPQSLSDSESGNKESDTINKPSKPTNKTKTKNKAKITVSKDFDKVEEQIKSQFEELEDKEANAPEGQLWDRYQNKYITFDQAREGVVIILNALNVMANLNGDYHKFISSFTWEIKHNIYNPNQTMLLLVLIRLIGEFEGKVEVWYASLSNYLILLKNKLNN